MWRRALWSASRWRSRRHLPPGSAAMAPIGCDLSAKFLETFQARGYGVANVWIDEKTAAARAVQRTVRPRRHKVKQTNEENPSPSPPPPPPPPRSKPTIGLSRESRRLLRKGETMKSWKDGTPRPPGPEGTLRMLDSGKLLGRDRKTMVQKYGMPKRIPRKIRLVKLEQRRERKELRMKIAENPELEEELLKKYSGPNDSGAARRLREKGEGFSRMNKMERWRVREEREAGAYFARPLKCDEKKVATVFGDMDVTAAAGYKEWKARKKEMAARAAELKEGADALARMRMKALEASRQKLLGSGAAAAAEEGGGGEAAEIGEKARKMIEEGKELLKMAEEEYQDPSGVLAEKEVAEARERMPRGLILENDAERKRRSARQETAAEVKSEIKPEVEPEIKSEIKPESFEKPRTETERYLETSKLSEESKASILNIGESVASADLTVKLVSDDESSSDEEVNEKMTWALDSTRPIDDTEEGRELARLLGTSTLLGFPRLTKAKKTRPARKARQAEEDEDIVFSAKLNEQQRNDAVSTLYQPEERSISLERQIIEKTLEEYHMILLAERATPRKKPWIRRILKVDKDDETAKRYETPEERRALGRQEPKELSANARFRMIQPSRELMRYIDSQLLGKRRLDEWRKAGYNVKLHSPLDNQPFYKGEIKYRIHQSVFRNKLLFVAGAKSLASIPPAELPEIAFAGRTNAGKSKLINALTRHYGKARTSPKPGKTDSINFYVLDERLCLVDMPGYSFMYGKQEQIEDLRQLNKDYITVRDHLNRVCLLVDAQWGIRQKDQEFIEFLESVHRKYQIVLTKTDKVMPLDLGRRMTQTEEILKDCKYHVSPVMMVSAKSGAGIAKFRMALAGFVESKAKAAKAL